jgi:hypothetical protein
MNGWSDDVFCLSYRLRSLNEVEAYVNRHHHLPGVPSENEVLKNGQDIGEMNRILLEKVEELTLYLVEERKQVESLKKRLNQIGKKGKGNINHSK